MKEIGNLLKKARMEKKLSLDDIKDATKIRLDHLESIENGDFEKLPGEIYTKGFIMNFARTVGLDEHEILDKYYEIKKAREDERRAGGEEADVDNSPLESFKEENSSLEAPFKIEKQKTSNSFLMIPYLMPAIAGLIVVALIIIGTIVAFNKDKDPVDNPATVEVQESETPVEPETGPNLETINQGAHVEQESERPVEPPILKVRAKAVVWIGLYEKGSGKMIYEGTLRPNDLQEWTLTKPVQMRVGNIGGINLVFRGQDLGVLGEVGEVGTLEFSPDTDDFKAL